MINPKVFINILNFGNEKITYECLDSLHKMETSFPFKILLIDNAVLSSLPKKVKNFSNVSLIKNQENLGFAEGNNVGIREALRCDAEYILLLNNDTVVDKNFLDELLKIAQREEIVGLLSPKIYFAPGFEFHKNRYQQKDRGKVIWYAGGKIDWQNILGVHTGVDHVDQGENEKVKETEFATGCAMLVKRKVFEKIGLFDSRFFLYLEDLDFNVRAKKAGFKILFVPQAKIWHKNLGTKETSIKRQQYFYTRNRLLFALKHAALRTKISLLKWSLIKLRSGSYWEKKGILDFYLNKFGKGSFYE